MPAINVKGFRVVSLAVRADKIKFLVLKDMLRWLQSVVFSITPLAVPSTKSLLLARRQIRENGIEASGFWCNCRITTISLSLHESFSMWVS